MYLYRGQHESAMREIERALKINPADVDARHWLAVHHWHSGDSATAEKLERENVARNPRFFPARMTLGAIALERGDWEASIRNYGSVLEYDAQNPFVLQQLTRAYLEIDDLANARHTLTLLRPEDRCSFLARALEALLLALEGKREAATNAMDSEVLKYLQLNRLWTLTGAEFYSVMGNRPSALDWLERAVRQGDNRVSWFARNSTLKAIRSELRYQQIVNLTRSTRPTM
jgi:tetratricopeptide (TPR) repeat protein